MKTNINYMNLNAVDLKENAQKKPNALTKVLFDECLKASLKGLFSYSELFETNFRENKGIDSEIINSAKYFESKNFKCSIQIIDDTTIISIDWSGCDINQIIEKQNNIDL